MNKITALHSSLTYITEKREDRVPVLEHKYLGKKISSQMLNKQTVYVVF